MNTTVRNDKAKIYLEEGIPRGKRKTESLSVPRVFLRPGVIRIQFPWSCGKGRQKANAWVASTWGI